MATTTGTKTAATRSTRRWTGAFVACACLTSFTTCARAVSFPTRVAFMTTAPFPFTVAPEERVARHLLDRDRLARDERLVHRRRSLDENAVRRHLLAREDAQEVAGPHPLERHLDVAVRPDEARLSRAEPGERADRLSRLPLRPLLEESPEEDERDDDDRGFEVDRSVPARDVEEVREERRRRRREERRRRAEGDERVHVRGETPRGARTAHEDVAPREAEDDHGQSQKERVASRKRHFGHRENRDRHRDRDRHGEPQREVFQGRGALGLLGVDELLEAEEVRVLRRSAPRSPRRPPRRRGAPRPATDRRGGLGRAPRGDRRRRGRRPAPWRAPPRSAPRTRRSASP